MLTSFMTACYDVLRYRVLLPRANCRVLWPCASMSRQLSTCCDVEWVGRMPKIMSQLVTWLMSSVLDACLKWWVSWAHAVMSSELAACQKFRASWPRANMIWFKDKKSHIKRGWLSLLAASYIVEFYDRVLWYVVIMSFMAASYVVEFYDCVPGCRVSWPDAKTCCDIVYIENVLEKIKIFLI